MWNKLFREMCYKKLKLALILDDILIHLRLFEIIASIY